MIEAYPHDDGSVTLGTTEGLAIVMLCAWLREAPEILAGSHPLKPRGMQEYVSCLEALRAIETKCPYAGELKRRALADAAEFRQKSLDAVR